MNSVKQNLRGGTAKSGVPQPCRTGAPVAVRLFSNRTPESMNNREQNPHQHTLADFADVLDFFVALYLTHAGVQRVQRFAFQRIDLFYPGKVKIRQ